MFPGKWGVRIEDMVVVTERRVRSLDTHQQGTVRSERDAPGCREAPGQLMSFPAAPKKVEVGPTA